MNSYEHQKLRKQYYQSYDIPFCECGGTFHYDKTICEFVCDECGATINIIDRDRNKKGCKKKEPDKCWYCGKPIKQTKGKGRLKKYCSAKCRDSFKNEKRKNKTLNPEHNDWFEDRKELNKEFQDDRYWGLGESTLKEHIAVDFDKERRYVKYEKKRLLNRR